MKFKVRGLRHSATETMLVDATDAAGARTAALAAGLAVFDVAPADSGLRQRAAARMGFKLVGGGKSSFDVDLFCEELLALLDAGISVGEALETLASKARQTVVGSGARATTQTTGNSAVVDTLLVAVRAGQPLSAALARQSDVFPALLCESLRAAEQTSDYGPALTRFVRYRRLAREVRGKLLTAALYPLIVLGVSLLVVLFLLGYVVPRFADVYAEMGDKLPFASRVLLWLGQGLSTHGWAVLTVFLIFCLVVRWAVMRPAVRAGFGELLYRIPRVSQVLAAADYARLYRTLALLLHGGVPLVQSLDIARGLLPAALAVRLDACRRSISEGAGFAASMAGHGLATVVADRFFRVGERGGNLAAAIDRAAEFHEDEVGRGAEWFGRLIGPVLMLAMGLMIGVIVVLMYLPIFQLAEAVQ